MDSGGRADGRPPPWLLAAAALFTLLLASLVAVSLVRRRPPGHPPTPVAPREAGDSLVTGLVTLDARDRRGRAYFDFSRLAPVDARDPAGWDVAARRHHLIVNGGEGFAGRGGVIGLAGAAWEEVVEAPADGYEVSRVTPGGDSVNAALDDWYRYGFFSHLLEPKPAVYVVRTADGRYAKLRFLSYYCPGADPGCPTFEYAYQGDGTRRLASRPRPPRDAARGPVAPLRRPTAGRDSPFIRRRGRLAARGRAPAGRRSSARARTGW